MTVSDDDLLLAVARVYQELDPAPADIADGALARLAVEDLEVEFELFTLVQSVDTRVGTRQGSEEPETSATVALEFAGTAYRVLVRISDAGDGARRLDGWVVPALPMRAFLGPQGLQLGWWIAVEKSPDREGNGQIVHNGSAAEDRRPP